MDLSKKNQEGFTLFELLIVIAMIAILVSIAVVSYSSIQLRARDSRRSSDLKAIQNASEQYYAANSAYPGGTYPNLAELTSTYLPNGAPTDPKTGNPYIVGSWTTSAYSICADQEVDGTFDGTNSDTCVTNLQ